jgi:hypothetical protein
MITRAGRIQSADRAVPTPDNRIEGYEPSFSLISADSRRVEGRFVCLTP